MSGGTVERLIAAKLHSQQLSTTLDGVLKRTVAVEAERTLQSSTARTRDALRPTLLAPPKSAALPVDSEDAAARRRRRLAQIGAPPTPPTTPVTVDLLKNEVVQAAKPVHAPAAMRLRLLRFFEQRQAAALQRQHRRLPAGRASARRMRRRWSGCSRSSMRRR